MRLQSGHRYPGWFGLDWSLDGARASPARFGELRPQNPRCRAFHTDRALRRLKTEVLRANGSLIMPGFADGAHPFCQPRLQLASVDLRDAATPQEFVRRLKEYAAHLRPGEWILGGDWDHTLWRGRHCASRSGSIRLRRTTRSSVDRLMGTWPSRHAAAMRAAGVTNATRAPFGGEITSGGVFKDNAER